MIRNTLNALNTPVHRNQARITKADKGFAKKLQFKDVKLEIHTTLKKKSICISIFG